MINVSNGKGSCEPLNGFDTTTVVERASHSNGIESTTVSQPDGVSD
ncbi:hypothetical protein [Sphingobium boeckii]|uniref:Uncharacterized protein n=1 Tax=Sphingobium boeckii TaxID=1082345 RepID=A0A7W9AFS9_9SPHN|nr:hypothetical protein [Sphingobium boeckii]MBB5684824.1 hypothetical protein [Sphingobium boeckii]